MAQPPAIQLAGATGHMQQSLWRRLLAAWEKDDGSNGSGDPEENGQGPELDDDPKPGLVRRVSRKVVPGLPRTQTFKRQRSEVRSKLEPVRPSPAERRAVSVDRRAHGSSRALNHSDPRTSAPDFLHHFLGGPPSPPLLNMASRGGTLDRTADLGDLSLDQDSADDSLSHDDGDARSRIDAQSMTTSQYGALIESELERKWILNLSMYFRDRSRREKFFVTYRPYEHLWRRVTISLDYRNAPENSLEADLASTEYQRDKSAKIYEAIRDSLPEIDFYPTVTNLKLETKEGRLHVHVVEDVNEIITYPPVNMVQHVNCRRIKEREIHFDSHLSGFVYKVRVHGRLLIKKEIPGPDMVDEFLYEINALHQLYHAKNVIQLYGIVVDDRDEHVTGLLISYAARGALVDVIYDNDHSLPWPIREKWARQIVSGLSEIHESGFVQGDFTLSNIVIDENDDAKIIDINRRGCPIGWEPPEVTPLIASSQRISMYIGVKSDLYQLGMVLWALAMQEDEPERYERPLKLRADIQVPAWYRSVVDTCLNPDPRNRAQASQLLLWLPDTGEGSQHGRANAPPVSGNGDGHSRRDYLSPAGIPRITTLPPPSDWAYVGWGSHHLADEPFYYPSRGRSPPSPMPSNQGDYGSSRYGHRMYTWSATYNPALRAPSVSDDLDRDLAKDSGASLGAGGDALETYADGYHGPKRTETENNQNGDALARTTGGEQVDPTALSEATSGVPPLQQRTVQQRHALRSVDRGSQSGGRQYPGGTGPGSRADSGKDVTDTASTPGDNHRQEEDLDRRGSRAKSSSSPGSSIRRGNKRDTLTATAGPPTDVRSHTSVLYGRNLGHGEGEAEVDRVSDIVQCPPPADLEPPAGYTLAADDLNLKGVGSAYATSAPAANGGHDERRQREMILDEDLSAELDRACLTQAILATDDRRS